MKLNFPVDKAARLSAALDAFEDAERTGESEYVVDFYDFEPPLSMELAFAQGGVEVLAAQRLSFDEELDGYYLSGPENDAALIARALETLL